MLVQVARKNKLKNLHDFTKYIQTRFLYRKPTFSEFGVQQRLKLKNAFPELVEDLTTKDPVISKFPEICQRLKQTLDYNILQGGLNRPVHLLNTYKSLTNEDTFNRDWQKISKLGWCNEMINSHFVFSDDIIDGSPMRRGLPSWYTLPHVGTTIIFDVVLFECGVHNLLKKYFRDHKYYCQLMDLFRQTSQMSSTGQLLDMEPFDMKTFNWLSYDNAAFGKSTFVSYYTPTKAAIFAAGQASDALFNQIDKVLYNLGRYFQIKNDYKDWMVPEFKGIDPSGNKESSDVQSGKKTWFSLTFLDKATNEQKEIFKKHYGVKNDESENIVLKLYTDIGMLNLYEEFIQNYYNEIKDMIENLDERRLILPLTECLDSIH